MQWLNHLYIFLFTLYRIRETKHLSTDADSSADTKKIMLVTQNLSKIKLFFARQLYTLYEQKYSNLRPLLSISFPQGFRFKKFGHWTSGVGANRRLNRVNEEEKIRKNFFCIGNFRPFLSKNVHIWDHFFPLIFPKDSESLIMWDIRLREVGAKIHLNGTSKVNKWRNKYVKKTFVAAANLDRLWAIMFKYETTSFQQFSPRIPNL